MGILDQSVLDQFEELQMDGEPDILLEVIDSFLETSPKRILDIENAVKSMDLSVISSEAHGLKSSARTLGAMELGNLCQELEDVVRENKEPEEIIELLSKLKEAFGSVVIEFKRIKTKRSS